MQTLVKKLHFAAFDGERQMTPWRTAKDRVISAVRKSLGLRHGVDVPRSSRRYQRIEKITIRKKFFLEKRGA